MNSPQTSETETPPRHSAAHRELLETLLTELAQTERSAATHCRREARRLGATPPAGPLRSCWRHAEASLEEFGTVVRAEGLRVGRLGVMIGSLFSAIRDGVIDRLVENERSYRGTLLGLRHGVDVVRIVRHVADASGRVELAGFCTRWLETREPLIEEVQRSLTWFAHHPEMAMRHGGLPTERARRAEAAAGAAA